MDNYTSPFLCFVVWWWAGMSFTICLHFITVTVFNIRQVEHIVDGE